MSSLLPSNRTDLETGLESSVSRTLPNLINTLWHVDNCPAEFLAYLAWALAVFEWDDTWSEPVKRQVIRDSISVYQHLGTPGSLKTALQAMGYELVEIVDVASNTYNGKNMYDGTITYGSFMAAYLFDVILHTTNPVTTAESDRIKARIELYKNARSHLQNLKLMTILYNNTHIYDGIQIYNGGIV